MAKNQSVFKSEEAKKAYFAAYDRTLESWPVPYDLIFAQPQHNSIR